MVTANVEGPLSGFPADCSGSRLLACYPTAGGVVSVQVLNEFASVASRTLKMSIAEIREVLAAIRAACTIVPISEQTHDVGLQVAERYGLSVYAAMIVASALLAGCKTVISEDMQDGQTLEGRLRVRNPFR